MGSNRERVHGLTLTCRSLVTRLSYALRSPALTQAAHSRASAFQHSHAQPPFWPHPWGLGTGCGWVAPSSFPTAVGFPLSPDDLAPLTLLTMAAHVQVAEVRLKLRSHHDLLQRQRPRDRGGQEAGRGADEGLAAAQSPGLRSSVRPDHRCRVLWPEDRTQRPGCVGVSGGVSPSTCLSSVASHGAKQVGPKAPGVQDRTGRPQ